MAEIEELKQRLRILKEKIKPQESKKEIDRLEAETMAPDFWHDQERASRLMKQLSQFRKEMGKLQQLELLLQEGKIAEFEKVLQKMELRLYFSGQYDSRPALLSIHAGQGGIEAMDWAQMLLRMYLQYFKSKSWEATVLDENLAEEAGIKNVTLAVDEPYAYGYLQYEAGTHRLVRQSPFNADRLRQTSFALVEVLPQLEEKEAAKIAEDELEWQFFRASTQGGQNVQKVSTAVRLLHKPSGIIVTCQSQRYQEQNRKIALQLLQARLWQQEKEKQSLEIKKLKKGRTKAAWGTQIRSYVLHPYKMVKDLRTGAETAAAESVLDGNLDEFIEAEIRQLSPEPKTKEA